MPYHLFQTNPETSSFLFRMQLHHAHVIDIVYVLNMIRCHIEHMPS